MLTIIALWCEQEIIRFNIQFIDLSVYFEFAKNKKQQTRIINQAIK